MKRRVADIIMDIVVDNGITDCFAVVGGGAMHIDNALAMKPEMNKVFCHHEQVCAMAAEGYAKACGRMALVSVTSGPGAINTFNGVQGAWVDNVPMLVIAGFPRYETTIEPTGLQLRCRGVQEFDAVSAVKGFTKYASLLTNPLDVRKEVLKAIEIARTGRKGPVWLSIPLDVQGTWVEEDDLAPAEDCMDFSDAPDHELMIQLNDMIQSAKRPCILTGSGIRMSGAVENFRTWVEAMEIPVVGGALQADILYEGAPFYYGTSGTVGGRKGNFILQNADLIIVLGNSLPTKQTGFYMEGFAPNAKIVMVDISEDEMRKPGLRVDLRIRADINAFLRSADNTIRKWTRHDEWITYLDHLDDELGDIDLREAGDAEERVSYYVLAKEILDRSSGTEWFALGNSNGMLGFLQIGAVAPGQRMIVNYNTGSMGDDIPEAIGMAVASNGERTIYCITGDGSIMMNLQDLQTIHHYDLPVKIVILSNDGYGALRQTNKNFFQGTYIGCDKQSGVSFPDFGKIADAFGFRFMECHNNGELADVVDAFLAEKGRTILVVDQLLDDPILPKVMSRMNEDGTFHTPCLHEMYPFIGEEVMRRLMIAP